MFFRFFETSQLDSFPFIQATETSFPIIVSLSVAQVGGCHLFFIFSNFGGIFLTFDDGLNHLGLGHALVINTE